MICFNCGLKQHSGEEKECPLCGVKFAVKCPSCSFLNSDVAKFCFNCGHKIKDSDYQSSVQNFDTLSESRKNVAVIFADVSGFTALSEKLDPEEVREIINDCFSYITKPVYELEGTIDKYIGDCVMILFGAKYQHTDDAMRSVMCAMKMLELVREFSKSTLSSRGLSLDLSIGVNYGLVVTGSVGNYYDKDYTVMGDIVNTAQRLQSRAGLGNVLISESVFSETRDNIEYSSARELTVKNKGNPVRCYSPIKMSNQYFLDRQTFIIERENEVSHLNSIYNNILNSSTQCINIVGEAGIGKTTLIKDFISKVNSDVKKIWVDCSPISQNRVYFVISNILMGIMNISSEDGVSIKQHRLASFLDYILKNNSSEVIKRNYDFLSLILGLGRDNEFQRILDSTSFDSIKRELSRQLVIFFTELCNKYRVIIVIEDMHWVDNGSLSILRELILSLSDVNLAFIISSRQTMDDLADLSLSRNQNLKLAPLSDAGTRLLASKIFNSKDIDDYLLKAIVKFSKGNPLYIKEFVLSIKRAENYYIKDGIVFTGASEEEITPSGIQNLILANLSELDEQTKDFLQAASVVGMEFNLSLVNGILDNKVNEAEVMRLPIELNVIFLKSIYTSAGVIEKIFNFVQEVEREAIYSSILNRKKKVWHRKIGEFIEVNYSKDIENYFEILSTHFKAAGIDSKSAEYYFKTAVKYKNDFNFNNAIDFYSKFFEQAVISKEKTNNSWMVTSYMDVSKINSVMANYDLAIDSLNKAKEYAELSNDVYLIKLMMANIYKEKGEFENALLIIEEIESKTRMDSNLYGELLGIKCEILRITGNPLALSFAKKSEKILLKAKEYQSLSQTMNQAGIIFFTKGDIDNSIFYFNKSYNYAEKINSLEIMEKVSGNLGIIYYSTGRVSKASEFFSKSIDLSRKIYDQQGYITGCNNLGILYLDKGFFSKAEELFTESLQISREISSKLNECTNLNNLGDVMYERGLNENALEFYNKSLAIASEINILEGESINLISLSRLYLKLRDLEKIPGMLQNASEIINNTGEVQYTSDYFRLKALYFLHLNQGDQALEFCERAIETSLEYRDERRRLKGLRLKGVIFSVTAEYEKALKCFDESIILAELLESGYETAKGYYRRCAVYKQCGKDEEAQRDINTAIRLISQIEECRWTEIINAV